MTGTGQGFTSRVQASVDRVLATEAGVLLAVSPDLEPLVGAVADLMRGGKRLRPAFAYWGWRGAASATDLASLDDAAIEAASSLEFLQACALIHDDVMDRSDTRRGMPAAHHRFATLHRREQWLGTPEDFGNGAAILLGDLCLSWADQALLTCGLPAEALARAKAVYDEMRTELMAGQYLDLLEQARGGGSVERAMRVVRYKSAKYTIERPLHVGAALAGATPAVFEAYSAYGLPLGEAFQLRDDVLGVFGDPAETGKPAGDDLREGKRTVLIAVAAERASAEQSAVLRSHLGDPALDADGVQALRSVIEATGALAHAEGLIDELLARALEAAASAPISDEAKAALAELAVAATRRTL